MPAAIPRLNLHRARAISLESCEGFVVGERFQVGQSVGDTLIDFVNDEFTRRFGSMQVPGFEMSTIGAWQIDEPLFDRDIRHRIPYQADGQLDQLWQTIVQRQRYRLLGLYPLVVYAKDINNEVAAIAVVPGTGDDGLEIKASDPTLNRFARTMVLSN